MTPETVFNILLSRLFPLEITWTGMEEAIVLKIRLPRVLLAMFVGAGLAVAGAAFQGLFGNPLVSLHILGVSAGAGFGAVLGIMLSLQVHTVQLLALGFGLFAVVAAYSLSRCKHGTNLLAHPP